MVLLRAARRRRCRFPGADDDASRAPIDAAARPRFASDGGPLARFVVVRAGAERALVAIVCHHLVIDGATHALLATRLGEALEGDVAQEPEQDYADLVSAVRTLEEDARVEGVDYWLRRLPAVVEPEWTAASGEAPAGGGTWLGSVRPGTTGRLAATVEADERLRMFHLLTAAVRAALPGDPAPRS